MGSARQRVVAEDVEVFEVLGSAADEVVKRKRETFKVVDAAMWCDVDGRRKGQIVNHRSTLRESIPRARLLAVP